MSSLNEIREKIDAYKKKVYMRQLITGVIAFLILSISTFLFLGYLEHTLWMSSSSRSILFFSFILILSLSIYWFIIQPLLRMLQIRKGLNDKDAATDIANFFPEIEDRLINVLQLGTQINSEDELLKAAIDKKSTEFKTFSFVRAVDFSIVKKYGFVLSAVFLCLLLVSFINPEIVSESPKRIANYQKEFERKAPFSFELLNESLNGFKGEDFTVNLEIKGNTIPEKVYMVVDQLGRIQLSTEDHIYSYTFENLQNTRTIQFEASGFESRPYLIDVHERPNLLSMNIFIQYPQYTGGERKVISNTGDLNLLEGSSVRWEIDAISTNEAQLKIKKDSFQFDRVEQEKFISEKRIYESNSYELLLTNEFSRNISQLTYSLNVIKDLFPKIQAEFFPDSSTYQAITIAGNISDDYGFSRLTLNYRKGEKDFERIPLEINPQNTSQSFYANWDIDTLKLSPGTRLELFLEVADNDKVNGSKVSRSRSFLLQIPTEEEIDNLLTSKSEGVENQLDKAKIDAESISEKLAEIEDRLKSEQKFDWQEKKLLEDVIEDREELSEQIEELQKKHEELRKSNDQFRQQSHQLQNKSQKMQELLDQLMDEETRKLYEKLKELMKENAPQDQVAQQLEQLRKNENNLERDLERALELFKRLKMESALEQNMQKLDSLSKQQDDVAKRNTNDQEIEDSTQEQENINQQFDDFREKMDEVLDMNQELRRPEPMEDFEYEERQIAKELREIMEEMKQQEQSSSESQNQENQGTQNEQSEQQTSPNQKENAQKQRQQSQQKQKNAAQKMKNLSQKLNNMQGGMQMEMMQANLDQLRDILDNLVKLSFNQEEIMNEMREVNQSDPRFLELSQDQLKLKDDAKVIEDSLLSLASKVVQISSFVTKEVTKINESVDETLEFLRDRNRGRALSSQQFAMTSINNLALLLDDTMQQMQMTMSEAMGQQSGEKQQSKGLPDLQELQNQLGDQMNELKGSGKSGRELSEELARLAAEQEMIRRQMEMIREMEEGRPGGGQVGDDLQKAIDMMEKNEIDLVNKRLTQQLINRQKAIQTRLLEAEKAQREQETEEEREADRPAIISREIPPEFEEYLKLKKKEIELLKTIPIELNPFYKKEVNDYFRRISSEEQE